MRATGWSNGSPLASDAGYGLRISHHDRDRYFVNPGRRSSWNSPGRTALRFCSLGHSG